MRERGLGNSVGQLYRKLNEQHSEEWLSRVARYFTACEPFCTSSIVPNVKIISKHPPEQPQLPRAQWLLTVYIRDVLTRIDDVRAKLTSVFGTVLKMDSTKQIVRKLSGAAGGTAQWCSNVSNEYGQVLISVLTCSEGAGLSEMAEGLMTRYEAGGIQPPVLLYVDRDCCGNKMAKMFYKWTSTILRLDVWHFMRRLACCCTTESHQLYGTFMTQLSACIFKWDADDLAALCHAKKQQLARESIGVNSGQPWVSKKELALHCRRSTRGTEETIDLINTLITEFVGDSGRDSMGVPLFDCERIQQAWAEQKKHISCLQEPPEMQLYTCTGVLRKGDVDLPTYRCSRGSTSLESFHLHLNRFIPGDLISVIIIA